jgi:hypothetical protein
MTTLFAICATVGGTLLVCQFILTLVGVGAGHDSNGGAADFDHDYADSMHAATHHDGGHAHHGPNWFFGVVTFRTVVAAVAFFGLAGLWLNSLGLSSLAKVSGASLAGVGAMYLVHWLMQSMAMLRADGTIRIDRAVGKVGTVYVAIPGQNQGKGKVTLTMQTKTVELEARTPDDRLATGARVVVTRILDGEVVEVAAAPAEKEPANS